jgi:hypothetical protein
MYDNMNTFIQKVYVHMHMYIYILHKTHTYNISCYMKWYAVSYEVQCGVPPRPNDW